MEGKSLSRIEQNVQQLIGMLQRQLALICSAGDGLHHLHSRRQHSYQADPGYSSAAGGKSQAEQIQAQQAAAAATTKAEEIKRELEGISRDLQDRLRNWCANLNELQAAPRQIKEVGAAAKEYQNGQNQAQEEINRIKRILSDINAALHHARQRMSGASGYSGGSWRGGIDEVVRTENTKGRFSAANNYGLSPVTYDTVNSLDAERYGSMQAQYTVEYPSPHLIPASKERGGSLSDKINQGMGYGSMPTHKPYHIGLPDHLLRALRNGYTPPGGTYSAGNW